MSASAAASVAALEVAVVLVTVAYPAEEGASVTACRAGILVLVAVLCSKGEAKRIPTTLNVVLLYPRLFSSNTPPNYQGHRPCDGQASRGLSPRHVKKAVVQTWRACV